MSKAGRLQDAFWDILDGYYYDRGEKFQAGPLHGMPPDEFWALLDRLTDAAWSILYPPRDDTPL